MKTLVKLGYLAAACALLVTIFSIIGPKAVRAAVATLIRDQDKAARHPFAVSCNVEGNNLTLSCSVPVPAGEEIVVQTATLLAIANSDTKRARLEIQTIAGGSPAFAATIIDDSVFSQPLESDFKGTLATTLYADQSTNIVCSVTAKVALFGGEILHGSCNLSGYYATLP